MKRIKEDFISRHNERLAQEDISLYQRPIYISIEWLKENNIQSDILNEDIINPIMTYLKRLYPMGDFAFPRVIIGGLAISDNYYKVQIPIIYGEINIDIIDMIDIESEQLDILIKYKRMNTKTVINTICDLYDFGYGLDDLKMSNSPGITHLTNASLHMEAVTAILTDSSSISAAIQSICLIAELAMKGSLLHLGCTDKKLKNLSHNLISIASTLINCKSLPSDEKLIIACKKLPDYVMSRYTLSNLKKVEVLEFAQLAQYIAAESVRRITDRELLSELIVLKG